MPIPDYRKIESFKMLTPEAVQNIKAINLNIHTGKNPALDEGGAANSDIWKKNAIANREAALNGSWISELYSEHTDGAALVMGAGPSLRKHLDAVRSFDGFKIAVDRAYMDCIANNLPCDLVVCLDASEKVIPYIKDLKPDTPVAVNIFCHPDLAKHVEARGGQVYWFGPINPFSPLINDPQFDLELPNANMKQTLYEFYGSKDVGLVMEGILVSFAATDVAARMGFKVISSIGVDLQYQNVNEAFQSGNVVGGQIIITPGTQIQISSPIRDSNGNWMLTADAKCSLPSFVMGANSTSHFPVLYSDVKFVDCSSGLVGGWEKVDLDVANTFADSGLFPFGEYLN